jgi:hypothetical protein
MKVYCMNGSIALHILDLGTRWRWVVSFTSQPFYPQGKSPWCPLDRMWQWREKFPASTRTQTCDHPAHSPVLYHWTIPAWVQYIYIRTSALLENMFEDTFSVACVAWRKFPSLTICSVVHQRENICPKFWDATSLCTFLSRYSVPAFRLWPHSL